MDYHRSGEARRRAEAHVRAGIVREVDREWFWTVHGSTLAEKRVALDPILYVVASAVCLDLTSGTTVTGSTWVLSFRIHSQTARGARLATSSPVLFAKWPVVRVIRPIFGHTPDVHAS